MRRRQRRPRRAEGEKARNAKGKRKSILGAQGMDVGAGENITKTMMTSRSSSREWEITMKARTLGLIAAVGTAAVAVSAWAYQGHGPAVKTVENLKAAYLGETTAHVKYAAYARVADREGFREVAKLFRAASDAEQTHAKNHQVVLAQLGVSNPPMGKYSQGPGTTQANLKDALKGETYEKDSMYPVMIRHAKAEKQADAARSMYYALSAEKQHAALYKQALDELGKGEHIAGYYVCPVCGATYTRSNVPNASPVCGTKKENFKPIN